MTIDVTVYVKKEESNIQNGMEDPQEEKEGKVRKALHPE